MSSAARYFLGVLSATCASGALAQSLVCAVADEACWQHEHEQMCRMKEATVQTCSEWLRGLEQSSVATHPNVRLTMASANVALSDFATDPTVKQEYRQRAARLYRDLSRQEPTNSRALLGLATFAETPEARLRLLREASASDPTNDALLELLAETVFPNDAREAAEILERAYAVAPTSRRRQHLVSKAIRLYTYAGALGQADAFRSRARGDFAIDARVAELASPAAIGPDRTGTALEYLCAADMIVIFGSSACVEGIVRAGEAAKGVNALDEGVARGVLTAAQSSAQLAQSDPEWRERFLGVLEPILASGTASSATYRALALITTDKEQRLRTMQNAAARFPTDGEIVFGLGLASYDLRKRDDAISAFSRAKGLLPDLRQPFIDQMLEQARALPE